MTKIYLIRHAEAEGNIYRRAHGHFNGLITERGYKQIVMLRDRFEGEQIDAIYSSDLSRASTTATALSNPRDLPVQLTDMLREVKLGVWEDTAWGDIEYTDRDMSEKFSNDPAQWKITNSESYENVKARMSFFITEAAKRHEGETIALFSHGFAIRAYMCHLKGIPSHETSLVPYCDNTAVTILHYEDDDIKIIEQSCNAHLNEHHSTLAHQTWWRTERKYLTENLRFMPLNEVASEDLLRIFQAKAGARAHVDKQYAGFLVDEPIGILGIDTKRDSKLKLGWLSYIHVVPARRKKNFATQLLGLAISDFRKMQREKLRIEIPSGSLGINFMSRCGFTTLNVSDSTCLMEMNIKNW